MPTIYKPQKRLENKGNSYDSDRRKIYNSEKWRRLRAWKFTCDPLCEECLKVGKIVKAEDIHHKVSFMSTEDIQERIRLAYDFDNLQSLCKKCHQKKHN